MKNKTLLTLAAAAILASAPAFAEDHGKEGMMHKEGMHKGKMFEAMDANADGMVSKDEFMAEHMKRFEKMDANADGNVSKDEIEAYRAAKKAGHDAKKAAGDHEDHKDGAEDSAEDKASEE